MKFQELLDNAAETVSAYRRLIFKTIIFGLLVCNGSGKISAIFRYFAEVFPSTAITRNRFYTFIDADKIERKTCISLNEHLHFTRMHCYIIRKESEQTIL